MVGEVGEAAARGQRLLGNVVWWCEVSRGEAASCGESGGVGGDMGWAGGMCLPKGPRGDLVGKSYMA
jgi:hypothetical protein